MIRELLILKDAIEDILEEEKGRKRVQITQNKLKTSTKRYCNTGAMEKAKAAYKNLPLSAEH